jgi:hypothetical protein
MLNNKAIYSFWIKSKAVFIYLFIYLFMIYLFNDAITSWLSIASNDILVN